MSLLSDFARVSERVRCPVCAHPDWCMVSRDSESSPSRAICARVESPRRFGEAGYLHVLRAGDELRHRHRWRIVPVAPAPDPELAALAEKYARNLPDSALERFSRGLGLTAASLRRFGLGWTGRAWAFPMRNEAGVVVGIALRNADGSKFAVKGSKLGLFVPRDLGTEQLLICEGQTDAAAALDLGFDAIGRPGAKSTRRVVCAIARRAAPAQIVVVSDRDDVGQGGAHELALALAVRCSDVRVVMPPEGVKDLRAWKATGANRRDLESAIAACARVRLDVHVVRMGGRA
jgi:hypothetical protein